ncbi:MAG TPA: hypothetical protein VMG40_17070 [Bryobacteraceae bacterium]|nr:hypothetical protein [Bryobacteraceae bacterium]
MNKPLLAIFALAVLSFAADKPDFSGNWKMDAGQSDFGGAPAPDSLTRKIEQSGPSVTFTDEQMSGAGNDKAVRKYTTDGSETTYQWMGSEVKSAAHWDGDALVIIGKQNAAGTDVVVTSNITLSSGGKTLIENDKITAGGNDAGGFKIVFVKH